MPSSLFIPSTASIVDIAETVSTIIARGTTINNPITDLDLFNTDHINHNALKAFLPSSVRKDTFSRRITAADLHSDTSAHSRTRYSLCPTLLNEFQDTVKHLGCITMCAVHDHNPIFDDIRHCPKFVTREAHQEFGGHSGHYMPHSAMAFQSDFFTDFSDPNADTVIGVYTLTQFIIRSYIRWIVDRIAVQVRKGYSSVVNFGAYFGLTKTEFFKAISPEVLTRTSVPEADGAHVPDS